MEAPHSSRRAAHQSRRELQGPAAASMAIHSAEDAIESIRPTHALYVLWGLQ